MHAQSLINVIPDAQDVLKLEPEELAAALLMWWNRSGVIATNLLEDALAPQSVIRVGGVVPGSGGALKELVGGYPQGFHDRLERAILEACQWLLREGFIAFSAKPGEGFFITRRGKRVTRASDISTYARGNLLPKGVLHPLIIEKVYAAFLRGDYDTAVFQAFREVEIAVRTAGKYAAGEIGEKLMRLAFDKDIGPLRDPTTVEGERLAMAHLFAGAMGVFRNSTGHRAVTFEAAETAEIIMLASYLLRVVDRRAVAP
jgi:uncharacterized protein (TIGR02391 family)